MIASMKRPCYGCETFDSAPRHEIIDQSGADTRGGPMHMDCCAELRGCEVCRLQLQRAKDHADVPHSEPLVNDALRNALVALPAVEIDHLDGDPFTVAAVREV